MDWRRLYPLIGGFALLAGLAHCTAQDRAIDVGRALFEDHFDGEQLDRDKWQIQSGFTLGRTEFREDAPPVADGFVRLPFDTYNPAVPGQTMLGTSIFTNARFAVGDGLAFESRLRMPAGAPGGMIVAFFTFIWDDGAFDEIDFELLTNEAVSGQHRVMINTWNDGSPGKDAGNPGFAHQPGLDLQAFNTYRFEWFPDRVDFYINGRRVRSTNVDVPDTPMHVWLNFWAPDRTFAVAFNDALQPTVEPGRNQQWVYEVDYVKVVRIPKP